MEKRTDGIDGDVVVHLIEHLEAFIGVSLKRIGLSIGTEPDGFPELGHLIDVGRPAAVDAIERNGLFGEVTHIFGPLSGVVVIELDKTGGEEFGAVGIAGTIQSLKA